MPMQIRQFVALLGISTLFLSAFRVRTEAIDLYFSYAFFPIILVVCLAAGSRFIGRGLILFIGLIVLHSAVSVAVFKNSPAAVAPQIVGISITSIVFYNIFSVNRFDTTYLFEIYTFFAKIAVSIGIIQAVSYIFSIKFGYDLSWIIPDYYQSYSVIGIPRIQSIFGEPSNFALMLSPAIFISVQNLTGRRTYFFGRLWSAFILLVALLSFSTLAYGSIFVAAALSGLNRGILKRTILLNTCIILSVISYTLIPDIQLRVNDSVAAFLQHDTLNSNISTLTLYNNWRVALDNLGSSYLMGGGLGSHPIAFEKYSMLFAQTSVPLWLTGLNAQDDNSLFLRILSELGLFGLLGLSFFLIKNYTGPQNTRVAPEDEAPDKIAELVSNAALAFIIMALIRQGHYFALGTPFFLMLYYYAGASRQTFRFSEDAELLELPAPPETAEVLPP